MLVNKILSYHELGPQALIPLPLKNKENIMLIMYETSTV